MSRVAWCPVLSPTKAPTKLLSLLEYILPLRDEKSMALDPSTGRHGVF